jgi:hypothetical protein
MSGDSHYIICAISDEDYESLVYDERWKFDKRAPSDTEDDAISMFRENPRLMLPRYLSASELPSEYDRQKFKDGYIDAGVLNSFARLFMPLENTKRFHEFQHLSSCPANILSWLSEDAAPMMVLFYAIGFSAAQKLPGSYGNMLIHKDELGAAAAAVRDALSGIDVNVWDRARRVISNCTAGAPSKDQDENIGAIFSALPMAFDRASKMDKHLLAFGFWFG